MTLFDINAECGITAPKSNRRKSKKHRETDAQIVTLRVLHSGQKKNNQDFSPIKREGIDFPDLARFYLTSQKA